MYDVAVEIDGGNDPGDPFRKSFGGTKRGNLPPMEQKLTTAEILNQILPPKESVEAGRHIKQYVSAVEAARMDVARLREMLHQKLSERQAREKPICPVREELFQQCFDEIIR